jgi:hypothetical protein
MLDDLGSNRVEMNVPGHGPQVGLILRQLDPVPTLEHVPAQVVPPRPDVHIGRKKPVHPARAVRLGRLDRQVEVVRHQHKGINPPGAADNDPPKVGHEPASVVVITDDV